VLALLRDAIKGQGAAGILVTHSQAAAQTTDRTLLLTRGGVSPSGRPEDEHRSAQREGSPVTPSGRPEGEHRSAQREGSSATPSGRPEGEHRSAQREGFPAGGPASP
jgi:ABC-type glutathione transport system ATPase component